MPERRLLYVITGLKFGGAERMLMQLATAPGRWAEQTIVVSLLSGGAYADLLRHAGIRVVELDFRGIFRAVRGTIALARLIRVFRPTIVQGWMYHGDLLAWIALALSGRRRQTGLLWSIRCSDLDLGHYSLALRCVVRACALLSSRPDVVTANSTAGMRAHLALGYRPRRAEVVFNGIDTDRFKPDPDARRVVRRELGLSEDAVVVAHVARVDPMKNHRGFIDAMAPLTNVHALLIGAGTELLPEAPRIHRLGVRSDVARLLAAADGIVSSSAFGEGFSNALAEGMACGLPAIATDVGDARDIVGDTGAIVPARDSAALTDAIRRFADRPAEEAVELGRRARARIVEKFTLPRAVEGFAALYESVADRNCKRLDGRSREARPITDMR